MTGFVELLTLSRLSGSALMRLRLQRPNRNLRVDADALRMAQYPTTERQLPRYAETRISVSTLSKYFN